MTDEQKPANATPLCWVRPATTIPELNGFQVCREGEGFPVYEHPPATPVIAEPVGYVSKQAIERFQDGRHADIYPSIEELTHEFFYATPMALYADSFAFQAQPEIRECANGECGWIGTTDRMCGSVGPLCPDCGETTEAKAQQPISGADGSNPTVKESLIVDERAAFEAWASDDGEFPKAVERSGHGYKLTQTQTYWMAWQARAALARQEEKQ